MGQANGGNLSLSLRDTQTANMFTRYTYAHVLLELSCQPASNMPHACLLDASCMHWVQLAAVLAVLREFQRSLNLGHGAEVHVKLVSIIEHACKIALKWQLSIDPYQWLPLIEVTMETNPNS